MSKDIGFCSITEDLCKKDGKCEECSLKHIHENIEHYAKLHEENRLIELPCAVGDTVWIISGTEWKGYDWKWKSYENAYPSEVKFKLSMLDGMGIDYFATEEEAAAKLAEINNRDAINTEVNYSDAMNVYRELNTHDREKSVSELTELKGTEE